MKNLILHSALLLILIVVQVIPGYLHIYNQKSNPKLKLCVENGRNGDMNILKGDLAYLEAIFSRALENSSNNKDMPTSLELTTMTLIYTSPSKIEIFKPLINIDKLLYSKNNNLSSIYLKIPSPPPKYIS